MLIIKITEEELNKAKDNAQKLVNTKTKYKFAAADYKSKVIQNFYVGNLGEVAYGKYIGLPPNFDIYKERGDGGSDFCVGDDIIQVKTCTFNGPNKELKADPERLSYSVTKLVLAHCNVNDPSNMELIGEISRADYLAKCFRSPYGSWMCVTEDYLTPIH